MSAEAKSSWPGFIPVVRRFFFGEVRPPKAKRYGETSTPTTSRYYEGMDRNYRWFRQDGLTRKCVLTNAYFATMTAGFETVLEAISKDVHMEDYIFVKEGIDEFNKRVNLDLTLFVAQVKRSIYGKAGFEIVLNEDETPSWLLSLQSPKLKPKLDENWNLTGYSYEGKQGFYKPDEVIYFVNIPLEADREGISDIEGIIDACQARHELLGENFPEIVRTLWAPYVILKANTAGLSKEEADKVLDDLAATARAGKSISVNESVDAVVVNITPDIKGLKDLKEDLDQEIIGNFGTPRFLLGRPIENRATAYAELEAYVEGPITYIQRYFKREIEAQWYDRWTRKILEDEDKAVPEDEQLPVLVKHRWNPIRVTDVYAIAKAVSELWGPHGMGPLGGRRDKVWEMMGWDKSELEEEKSE